MIGRTRLPALAAVLALSITTGVAVAGGDGRVPAADKANPKLAVGVATFRGDEIHGMVSAVQRGERREATLSVFVGGVGGGADDIYRVIGSKRPCARPTAGAPAFTSQQYHGGGEAMQDVFITEVVDTRAPLARVKSVRVQAEKGSTTLGDVVCSRFRVATQFQGTSQEGTGI